jgi:hypothetical protein
MFDKFVLDISSRRYLLFGAFHAPASVRPVKRCPYPQEGPNDV